MTLTPAPSTRALCTSRHWDPDWWAEDHDAKAAEFAKQVCGLCPRKETCLEDALEAHPVTGVWGGTTHIERMRIVRKRRRRLERAA